MLRAYVQSSGQSHLLKCVTRMFASTKSFGKIKTKIKSKKKNFAEDDGTSSRGTTRSALNMSQPHMWYPSARRMERTFILHTGPTNSGKTYQALKRLKASNRGIYLAPLRLLAWEICESIRAEGLRCDLVTGQERDYDTTNAIESNLHNFDNERGTIEYDYSAFDETHTSTCTNILSKRQQHHIAATVEMGSMYLRSNHIHGIFDVAVIDEAQLVGESQRGGAWTQAILGIPAKEIHLCGSPDMIDVVKRLIKETGDQLRVEDEHSYERLNPLEVSHSSLGTYRNQIRNGDCIVTFSRTNVYKLKALIEKQNKGHKCNNFIGTDIDPKFYENLH